MEDVKGTIGNAVLGSVHFYWAVEELTGGLYLRVVGIATILPLALYVTDIVFSHIILEMITVLRHEIHALASQVQV